MIKRKTTIAIVIASLVILAILHLIFKDADQNESQSPWEGGRIYDFDSFPKFPFPSRYITDLDDVRLLWKLVRQDDIDERLRRLSAVKDEINKKTWGKHDNRADGQLQVIGDVVETTKPDGSLAYEKFGFFVQLFDSTKLTFCSGVAISPIHFLTVGHCLSNWRYYDDREYVVFYNSTECYNGTPARRDELQLKPEYQQLAMELHDSTEYYNGTPARIASVQVPPEYGEAMKLHDEALANENQEDAEKWRFQATQHDIAIVQLEVAQFDVHLPLATRRKMAERTVQMFGFGLDSNDSNLALRTREFKVVDESLGENDHLFFVENFYESKDLGSPVLIVEDGKTVVAGIIGSQLPIDGLNYQTAVIRLLDFESWIIAATRSMYE